MNGKEIMSAGGIRKVQEHTRRGDGAILAKNGIILIMSDIWFMINGSEIITWDQMALC